MRILHLITDLGKGGAERFLLDLCSVLRERSGVEFVIGSLYDNDQYTEYTRNLPVVQLDYRTFSFRGGNDYPEYRELLDDFRPHVVHTHRFLAEFLSAHHVSDDVAYVCHGHDNMVQFANASLGTFFRRRRLLDWLEKRYLIHRKYRKVGTTFVANSTHTLRYYRSVLPGFMADDVRLVRYGFDYERFHAPEVALPGDAGPLRLINVGSFQAKKNQIFIVSVARELRRAGLDFEVHLLGDGRLRSAVEEEVRRHDLDDRIVFHGVVDDVESRLRESHICLHTATYEPFGLVLLEAMAAGLPCVILDGKGDRDLIEDGRNGYLITEEDPERFAERIRELATSPERYRAMATYAQEYARDFDIESAADRFLELYRELVGGSG